MAIQNPEYIDHEVRIQILEDVVKKIDYRFEKIDQRFEHMENKMDSQFKWIIGTLVGTMLSTIAMFGGVILTKLVA